MASVPQSEWDTVKKTVAEVKGDVDRLVTVLLDRDLDRTGVTAADKVQKAPARDLWRYADGNALVSRRELEALNEKVDELLARLPEQSPPAA